ncbi:hypothetical protein H2203_003925 [Taxawa tesnikishii (nom. ined.)]|nr:hypothetical protein H2203_003925 [Dothideales sp. JES 119]
MQNTAEDISNAAKACKRFILLTPPGHKANLSNPNTSDASKEHSQQVLNELGGENAFYGKQGAGEVDKNPGNVAGGLKAAINNPEDSARHVSEEGKNQAQEKLDQMK